MLLVMSQLKAMLHNFVLIVIYIGRFNLHMYSYSESVCVCAFRWRQCQEVLASLFRRSSGCGKDNFCIRHFLLARMPLLLSKLD